ncbi:MAG TPA: sugar phosphorylase [Firmicutes bacterium]|nr:sugar phosphorylase [Bacillota bacterium]
MSTFSLSEASLKKGREILVELYGEETGNSTYERLLRVIKEALTEKGKIPRFDSGKREESYKFDQTDAFLVTYGDQFLDNKNQLFENLRRFAEEYLTGLFSGVHLLPFYPYSSDDGFSVTDYYQVRSDLGDWEDVRQLSYHFKVMCDAVINHISAESAWFQGYLKGEPGYDQFFIEVGKDIDLSAVIRPRALPLLTSFSSVAGEKLLWTTFSTDQIDLNYANPRVLLKIIELLLFYGEQGVKLIRLDAVGYLWKEIGTTCLHLRQTHRIIQLFRSVLDLVYPEISLITETNVPHEENISYFGDGYNEAQMVYQFSLPPLVLITFYQENAATLTRWVGALEQPPGRCTFLNFLASHDGIGLLPVKGILTEKEINMLVEKTQAYGGSISYRYNVTGGKSPYELNISYFDALSGREEPESIRIEKFICAHSILLSLVGVPAIYIHSLFGSENDDEGVEETGRPRSINRRKFFFQQFLAELDNPYSRTRMVYERLATLLKIRRNHPAFHPLGRQDVLVLKDEIFSLIRTSPEENEQIICFHNVSSRQQALQVDFSSTKMDPAQEYQDLLTGRIFSPNAQGLVHLQLLPYEILWLLRMPTKLRS